MEKLELIESANKINRELVDLLNKRMDIESQLLQLKDEDEDVLKLYKDWLEYGALQGFSKEFLEKGYALLRKEYDTNGEGVRNARGYWSMSG